MNQEELNIGHGSDKFFDDVEGDLPVALDAAGGNAEVVKGDAPVPTGKVRWRVFRPASSAIAKSTELRG